MIGHALQGWQVYYAGSDADRVKTSGSQPDNHDTHDNHDPSPIQAVAQQHWLTYDLDIKYQHTRS